VREGYAQFFDPSTGILTEMLNDPTKLTGSK